MAEFLAMGGYAVYVWPSLGLSALVLAGLCAQSLLELRRRERELEALKQLAPHRRQRRESAGRESMEGSAR